MGWKAFKEHFRIGHIVQVDEGVVKIGSPYVSELISMDLQSGRIVGTKLGPPWRDQDLDRYYAEISAEPERARALLAQEDAFERSIVVYTFDEDQILELRCESADFEEWPIVTHCGRMMYQNTFSTDRAQVVEWAIDNARSHVKYARENLEEARQRVVEREARLANAERWLAAFEALKAEEGDPPSLDELRRTRE